DLADTVTELGRSHARLYIPHRMVHVDEDSSDTILVSLNIGLAPIPSVRDVEGQDLIFQMDDATGCVSRTRFGLPILPVRRSIFFLFHVMHSLTSLCRCLRLDYRSGEYLDVSPETTTQSLCNLPVEVLYTAKFSAACGLSEKFQDLVPDKTTHSLLEHFPLRAVSFELVTAGQSTEEVSVNPALYPAEPMNTILVEAE